MSRTATGARLLVLALPTYFAWEMLQAPAFTGVPANRWKATLGCALATLGDGGVVLAMFWIGALVFHDWRWFTPPRVRRYGIVVSAGFVLQAMIEWVMVHRLGLWGYKPWHPIVPLLDVGVVPILQSLVLLPLVFGALARWELSAGARAGDGPGRCS